MMWFERLVDNLAILLEKNKMFDLVFLRLSLNFIVDDLLIGLKGGNCRALQDTYGEL